jgi:hypothetical protein
VQLTHPINMKPGDVQYIDVPPLDLAAPTVKGTVTLYFRSDTPGLENFSGAIAIQWESIRSADGVDYSSAPYYAYSVQVDSTGANG